MSTNEDKKIVAQRKHNLEQKLGKIHLKAGWTAVPNVLLQRQCALGLDSRDINIIMVLFTYWWKPDEKPYPSKQAIAKSIGCDPSTVRKRIQKLEQAKFIKRIPRKLSGGGNSSNAYDLRPLLQASEKFSQEEIERRNERHNENIGKLERKKERLKLVA